MTLVDECTQKDSCQVEDLEGQGDDMNVRMANMEVVTDKVLKGANDLHMKVCGASWKGFNLPTNTTIGLHL